jgi:pyruvate,water dikinase
VLQETDPADVPAVLSRSEEGRVFLAQLQAYLDEYGQRSDKWVFSSPSWIEDPTPVISNMQDYITQPDRDLADETSRLATERERQLAQVRAQMADYPQPVAAHFEFLLKAAQEGSVLTEDHGFWIDFRGWYPVRCTFLEFGRRFAQTGVLEQSDDVFFLTLDEVRETAQSLPEMDRHPLVAGRQAELAYFRGIQPPPALGTPPAGPPADDPVSRTIGKFFGAPPQPSADPNVLFGNAGSPGTARGPARVITSRVSRRRSTVSRRWRMTETSWASAMTMLSTRSASWFSRNHGRLPRALAPAWERGSNAITPLPSLRR